MVSASGEERGGLHRGGPLSNVARKYRILIRMENRKTGREKLGRIVVFGALSDLRSSAIFRLLRGFVSAGPLSACGQFSGPGVYRRLRRTPSTSGSRRAAVGK